MVVDTLFPNPCRVVAIVRPLFGDLAWSALYIFPDVFFRINKTNGEDGSSQERN